MNQNTFDTDFTLYWNYIKQCFSIQVSKEETKVLYEVKINCSWPVPGSMSTSPVYAQCR
jgi:hypothetical protein